MALKDIWTNKTDGVDDILADDINAIANEVISNTENKADKADVHTKEEVDEQFERIGQVVSNATYEASTALTKVESKAEQSYVDSAINNLNEKANIAIKDINLNINQIDSLWRDKADKSDVYTKQETDTAIEQLNSSLDWVLIGEEEVTEADVVDAGENGVTAVTIDLGAPIEQWYKETRIDIIIPASTDINSVNNGLFVCMGATEALSLNADSGCVLMRAQGSSYSVLQYQYPNQIIFHTVWDKALPLYSLYVNSPYNGYAYAYNVYGTTTFNKKNQTAIGCQFISVSAKTNVGIFKFPSGTKISIYGRM